MGFLNGHLTTGGLGGLTWVSGQAYNQNDIVQHLGILYRVKLAHTSATAPASDTTNYEIANLSSSTLFLDATNSKVGIGTNAPVSKLHVTENVSVGDITTFQKSTSTTNLTTDYANLSLYNNNSSNNSYNSIWFYGDNSSSNKQGYAAISSIFTNTTTASESGSLVISTRNNGGAVTERLRINSTGQVDIGMPSGLGVGGILNLSGPATFGTGGGSFTGGTCRLFSSESAANDVGGSLVFGGNTGKATAIMAMGAIRGGRENATALDYSGNLQFFTSASNGAANESMRIDSSGRLLLGSSSLMGVGSGRQEVTFPNTLYGMRFKNTGATANIIQFLNQSGTQVGVISHNDTNTTYGTSSDYRLKKDVKPIENALQRVALLNPVTYKWISNDAESEGFIAHELAEVCPKAVCGEKDAVHEDGSIKPQSVDSSYVVALLSKAIQELSSQVEELKAKINVLENK